MKKFIALLCIFILCVSLVACGGDEKDKIHDELQGTWTAEWNYKGTNINRYYTFKGDKYTTGGSAVFGALDIETGTFEIRESTIHLIPDDGSDENDLDYTYNKSSGKITLWWNDDIQFEKGPANIKY